MRPSETTPGQVLRELRAAIDAGARLLPAGDARSDPDVLLSGRHAPRHKVELFDAVYYVTDFLFDEDLDFFVGYVGLPARRGGPLRRIHPRIFYKDSSLVWRVASHLIRTDEHNWIGKGDVKWHRDGDAEFLVSDEDTTNLPYEIQAALDVISRRRSHRRDDDAVHLVLRRAPPDRLEPYADFTEPRRRALAAHPIHGGRMVARIRRRNDPRSLRFAPGFEPDFEGGVLEVDASGSRLYGGEVRKHRVLSTNRLIQYQFVCSPTHVWVNAPQTLTTELTSYGIRALPVAADEDVFLPGYEYHFLDETVDPPELHTQIPAGFAGEPSPTDPWRADASAWIEELPVVREFRRTVLGQGVRARRRAR